MLRTFVEPSRRGLRELGYVEGQNYAFEFRWAEGKPERLPELLAELIALASHADVAQDTEVDMTLRSFGVALALATSALMLAPSTLAQTPTKPQRIGVLQQIYATSVAWRDSPVWKVFFASLAELGWEEGQNFVVERRSGEGRPERFPVVAAELVATRPDVIVVTVCGQLLNAAAGATSTIPIVVATCTDDMVAAGFVASLARPGGNVTGLQKLTPELAAKRLELLKQLLPAAARVGVLWNPGYSELTADWRALRRP